MSDDGRNSVYPAAHTQNHLGNNYDICPHTNEIAYEQADSNGLF